MFVLFETGPHYIGSVGLELIINNSDKEGDTNKTDKKL